MPDPLRPLAVFDVDGVLADVTHRVGLIERRPPRWDAFFAAADRDPVLPTGIALAARLAVDHEVVYLTGRPESVRALTETWLRAAGLPAGTVFMRADDDRRPARVLKPQRLRRLAAGREVALVIDDDAAVCAALRAAGWPVRQADWAPTPDSLLAAQEGLGADPGEART